MKTRWFLVAITMIATIVAVRAVAQHFVKLDGSTQLQGRTEGVPPTHAQFPDQQPADLQRSMEFSSLQVAVENKVITIDGQVHVYDTVPNVLYVWSVRVYQALKVLKEHHYSDQAAWLVEGKGVMQPQFHDQFPMAPGSYRVELSLYAVPQGFRFDTLKFGENFKLKVLSKVSRSKNITIE